MSLTHKRIYEFGEFRLKVNARLLERDGKPVPLGSKAFEVLTCLVMDAGQVVTKDALLKTVWPEAFVAEANLSQHIFALRKAFGDRAAFIVTIPGRGYQFTEQVREVQELPPSTPNDYGSLLLQRTRERTRIVIEDTTETSTLVGGMSSLPIALEALRTHSRSVPDLSAADQAILRYVASKSPIAAAKGNWFRRCLAAAASLPQRLRSSPISVWTAATAVALILLAGWFAPRRYASTPHANRRVVIAEFENRTGDSEFDAVLRKALEIDLDQSPYLDVMSQSEIEQTQQTDFAPAAATEVCHRNNSPVLITGSVANVGQLYLLTIEATDCQSGRVLAGTKAAVQDKEQMLDAVDAAAVKLRKALGESDESVQRPQSPAAH
jgi:eukaryotic-like serine/threonine-protein kinase